MADRLPPYRVFLSSDSEIRDLLREQRTVALLGLEEAAAETSRRIGLGLRRYGYRILPVLREASTWIDLPAFPDLDAIPERVDVVLVLAGREQIPELTEAALRRGARVLWLDRGVSHPEAAWHAYERGLKVIMNRCMLDEYEMHFPDDETGYEE